VEQLPVSKFFGVGKVTAARMAELGILTGKDLKQWEEVDLVREFGKAGITYYRFARGIDDREVENFHETRSISNEVTFSRDISDGQELSATLRRLSDKVGSRLRSEGFLASTVRIKIRLVRFQHLHSSDHIIGSIRSGQYYL